MGSTAFLSASSNKDTRSLPLTRNKGLSLNGKQSPLSLSSTWLIIIPVILQLMWRLMVDQTRCSLVLSRGDKHHGGCGASPYDVQPDIRFPLLWRGRPDQLPQPITAVNGAGGTTRMYTHHGHGMTVHTRALAHFSFSATISFLALF